MSRGINKVILVGNLGADPEVRYTTGGACITTIRIATSESWKDKHTGEQQERTEWHRIKFFGRLAEIAGEYLKKGRQVYIDGSLRTDKYTDKDGIERYTTDVIAGEMQMLGGAANERPAGRAGEGNSGSTRGTGGGTSARNAPPPRDHGIPPDSPHVPSGGDYEDDNIPFITARGMY